MRNVPTLARNLVLAAAASVALSACVVYPAGGYYEGPTVAFAPPAPQVEVVGVAPNPGYFWVGGYWGWSGGRYAWVPGRWSAPRPGYHWVGPHWDHVGGGWRMSHGGWRR